jgi:WD40 repeat protein
MVVRTDAIVAGARTDAIVASRGRDEQRADCPEKVPAPKRRRRRRWLWLPALSAIPLLAFLVFFVLCDNSQCIGRHKGGVLALAFSPDGRLVASAGWDCSLKVWDVETNSLCWQKLDYSKPVRAVAFSPDGKRLAAASDADEIDGLTLKERLTVTTKKPIFRSSQLKVFESRTGDVEANLPSKRCPPVSSVQFSPSGNVLATLADDGIRLWDSTKWSLVALLKEEHVAKFVFSPDGNSLAVLVHGDHGGRSKSSIRVGIWNHRFMKWRPVDIVPEVNSVHGLAFAPNGHDLAIIGRNIREVEEIREFGAKPLMKVEFDPVHTEIWDWQSGKIRQRFKTDMNENWKTLVYAPDSQSIAIGGTHPGYDFFDLTLPPISQATVHLLDVRTGEISNGLRKHWRGVTALAFSADGRILASGDEGGNIRFLDSRGN